MHLPFGLSSRNDIERNYASNLFSRIVIKRGGSNARSLSSTQPRGTLQLRATDQSTSTGNNNTVYIIIVRIVDVTNVCYCYLEY